MKLSAFVLGGIAGAAAVMLLRKQSLASMAGGMSQMMKGWSSGSKRDSQGKALSLLFGSGGGSDTSTSKSGQAASQSQASHNSHTSRASHAEESGIEQIAQIASKDDSVKKEINEILEQNEQPQI